MNTIHICFTVNDTRAKHLATTIASILTHANKHDNIFFHIIHSDLTNESKQKLASLQYIKKFQIEYVKTDSYVKIIPDNIGDTSIETNNRLMIGSLLPKLDKVICLSVNLIILTSLDELWEMDLRGNCVASLIIDNLILDNGSNSQFMEKTELEHYYSTGVMLVNLKKWREDNIEDKVRLAANQYFDIIRYHDQDLLNVALKNNVLELPSSWNIYADATNFINFPDGSTDKMSREPKIIQWGEHQKPWTHQNEKFSNLYWKYAKKTDYYQPITAKVSIIIPVYNSERTIARTVDSLLTQTYHNIEIICIDDGSSDGSLDILNQFAKTDSRIKVITQSNAGPAKARNVGLKASTADYIMFCDSDDWYEPEMCQLMLQAIIRTNVDLAACDITLVIEDDHDRPDHEYYSLDVKGFNSCDDQLVKCDIKYTLWNKIFMKATLLKYNICFPEGYEHDDTVFIRNYTAVCNNVYGIERCLYNYVIRKNSIMWKTFNNKKIEKIFDRVHAESCIIDFLTANNLWAENHIYFQQHFFWSVAWLYWVVQRKYRKELIRRFADLLDNPHIKINPSDSAWAKELIVLQEKRYDDFAVIMTYFRPYWRPKKWKKILQNIFSIKNKNKHKVLTICSLKLKFKHGRLMPIKKLFTTIFSIHKQGQRRVITILGLRFKTKPYSTQKDLLGYLTQLSFEHFHALQQQADTHFHVLQQQADTHYTALMKHVDKYLALTERNIRDSIVELNKTNFKGLKDLKGKVEEYNDILNHIVFWVNRIEYKAPTNNYERVWIDKFYENNMLLDYTESYMNLVRGLDANSINTVISVLSRVEKVVYAETEEILLFTNAEQIELRDLWTVFWSRIIKLSDECYAYGDYYLPINHFEACTFYYQYETESLQTDIANKDIIDAGGYIGDTAIVFSRLTNKKVYSFEPITSNYNNLLKTIALNEVDNIIPVQKGLGSKKETVKMSNDGSSSSVFFDGSTENIQEVEIITLDEYVEDHQLEVGLIKADLEGFEQEFLKGAKKTIQKFKPALIISIYHSANDFFQIKPLIESWDLGYKFKVVRPIDGHILLETILIAEVTECS